MKEGFVRKDVSGSPDMEKINRYTRRPYSPEEVYTFSLVLCDNQVDRDYERFSLEALEGSRRFYTGVIFGRTLCTYVPKINPAIPPVRTYMAKRRKTHLYSDGLLLQFP